MADDGVIEDGIADLGLVRARAQQKAQGEQTGLEPAEAAAPDALVGGQTHYVNDVTPSMDGAGNVVLECVFRSNVGVSDPVRLVMPPHLFLRLARQSAVIATNGMQVLDQRAQQLAAIVAQMKGGPGLTPEDVALARARQQRDNAR